MPAQSSTPVVNRLIDGLPGQQRDQLLSLCEPVDLQFGDILGDSDSPVSHVYFPLTGFISLVSPSNGHKALEMGIIGYEGMLGATLRLGIDTLPMQGVVQGSGTALTVTAAQFRSQLRKSPALGQMLDRYLFVLIEQLAQTATCNCFHEVQSRLARWLLLTHDRAHGDRFHLTHIFLAGMLGVRRSAVTIAAGELQNKGLIRYSRGRISVLSRDGLEAASCECYAASIRSYDRRLPGQAVNPQAVNSNVA